MNGQSPLYNDYRSLRILQLHQNEVFPDEIVMYYLLMIETQLYYK